MLRTAKWYAGKFFRPTVHQHPQQQQQQHQTNASASQYRSTSVLASLIRMRSQFQRMRAAQQQHVIGVVLARISSSKKTRLLGSKEPPPPAFVCSGDGDDLEGDLEQSPGARGDISSSTLQAGVLLCTEAHRLLRSEMRAKDPLSDVAPGSPHYAAEAGKLLSAAAAFGAATTYPRVVEVCAWIRANADTLCTTRQIMSLCMPLLNLSDGGTAGMSFVLEVLYEPLLLALHEVGRGSAPSTAALASAEAAPGGVSAEQQVVALTSAFGMVAKFATVLLAQAAPTAGVAADETIGRIEADAAVASRTEARVRMLHVAEATVASLVRQTSNHVEGERTSSGLSHDTGRATLQYISIVDVVQWLQSLHAMESAFAVGTAPATATAATSRHQQQEADTKDALRRLTVCYRVLTPLIERVLDRIGGQAAASEESATGAAIATASAAAASIANTGALRVQEVAGLVQVGLFPSVERSHTELALRYGLMALPATLAAASVRELCLMTQVVNKVRLSEPAALSPQLVCSLIAALRPRLFFLYGSNAYQLRAQDCSLLLSQLSRWEEVAGVTISADVVELLCKRFGEQLTTAQAPQLVPVLQALARLEGRHADLAAQRGGLGAPGRSHNDEEDETVALQKRVEGASCVTPSALARLHLRRRRKRRTVRYHYSTTARVVQQCAQRVAALASEHVRNEEEQPPVSAPAAAVATTAATTVAVATAAGTSRGGIKAGGLTAADAAHLVTSFVQLSSPLAEYVFTAVEPLLAGDLTAASCADGSVDQSSRVAVQEAVIRFLAFATAQRASGAQEALAGSPQSRHPKQQFCTHHTAAESTQDAVQRATALLADMEASLTAVVQQAKRPRDVVVVWPLVRHRLLARRAVTTEDDADGDAVPPPPPSPTACNAPTSPWSRAEVQLATCFAQQVYVVTPECNGPAIGALASALANLVSAGVLPAATAYQVVDALWLRCTEGIGRGGEAAAANRLGEAAPLTLNLESCKRLLDAARTTMGAVPASRRFKQPPPIFLHHVASLCTSLVNDISSNDEGAADVSHGTARAYATALADVRRYTALGRTMLSCYAASMSPPSAAVGADSAVVAAAADATANTTTPSHAAEAQVQHQAWCSAAGAYLDVVRAVMRRYAAEAALSESWGPAAGDGDGSSNSSVPSVPLDQLSMTARAVTQLQRLVHRHGNSGGATLRAGEPDVEESSTMEADPEDFTGVTITNSTPATAAAGAAIVAGGGALLPVSDQDDDVVQGGAVGDDTLAALDAAVSDVLNLVGDTIALLAKQQRRASLEGESEVGEGNFSPSPDTAEGFAMNPKHLLMLLQAFEMGGCHHGEMLYGILPELRSCATQLEPLQLSLLIRALSQLGAWNSRLLRVLASAVEDKVQACELRQCYSLLRDLCRSGSVSPHTFVELRGVACTDWARRVETTKEPLQRLAEALMWRLDALVRTKGAFLHLAKTAALTDLLGVVTTLSFFDVPPPPTFDAFVVLAIRQLVAMHARVSAKATTKVVQYALVLLEAAPRLRQLTHQRVSVQTLWAVVQRELLRVPRRFTSSALPLRVYGQLWQLACQHALRYGRTATAALFEASQHQPGASGQSTALLLHIQMRCSTAVEVYAWGPHPAADSPSFTPSPTWVAALLPLSRADQLALRRCGARATPSLLRGDSDLAEHLCFPLRLARRVVAAEHPQDLSALVPSSHLTAPARFAKAYLRLAACLLRADVWESDSMTAEAQLLLMAALQRLWGVTGVLRQLRVVPESFSTEELVVVTGFAAYLLHISAAADASTSDAAQYREACACAVRQLCAETTEWRLATAVDVWTLLVRFSAPPAPPQLRFTEQDQGMEGLFTVLARSGDVVVSAFLEAQSASPVTRARLLPELLRFFPASGSSSCVSCFFAESAGVAAASDAGVDHPTRQPDKICFHAQCAEVQRCIMSALTASPQG